MPSPYKNAIDDLLAAAEASISNAADPIIAPLLAAYGYDGARIAEGQALYDTALDTLARQRKEQGEENSASASFQAAREAADTAYMRLVKVARVALSRDAAALQELGLVGPRKRTINGWVGQARQFYTALERTPSHQAALTRYGITAARLAADRASFEAMLEAKNIYDRERGDSQDASEHREVAFEALEDWMDEFIPIARVALDEHPQLLEKLGVQVKG
ncbi:hypothetical protein F8S13_15060 [Chloroflexia bacterium SDU3-3]|nr:hypothetical protein F8S13_15060 [Chloroflexia bacterium SDU3-3]